MKKQAIQFSFLLMATSAIAGCGSTTLKREVADRLASPAWMIERQIPAGPFALTAYERMHTRMSTADVYIEGDGKAWLSKNQVSMDPTPSNPVALHLASKDKADNVIYLARPCQYSKMADKATPCDPAYWTTKRFSREVLDAYNTALDEIERRYDIKGFNLVGYSGGGAVAALLAAEREDVLSFRTVAGDLDHKVHSSIHGVSPLTGSMNPPDFAGRLRVVPQVHFIGGQDKNVTPAVLESYLQALGPTACVQYQMIQEASHDKGWVEKWPELLAMKPACKGPVRQEVEFLETTAPAPFHTAPEKPEKP